MQELLRSYLKKMQNPNKNNDPCKDINKISSECSTKNNSYKYELYENLLQADKLNLLTALDDDDGDCDSSVAKANPRVGKQSFQQALGNSLLLNTSADNCDISSVVKLQPNYIKPLSKSDAYLPKLFSPNISDAVNDLKELKKKVCVTSSAPPFMKLKNASSLYDSEIKNSCLENALTRCETDFTVNMDSSGRENVLNQSQSQRCFYPCHICSFRCERISQLKKHLLLHEKNSKLYECNRPRCNFTAICHSQLERHKKRHKQQSTHENKSPLVKSKNERTFYKSDEDKNYFESSLLYQEDLSLHKEQEVVIKDDDDDDDDDVGTKKSFVCEVCGFKARLKRDYKAHLEVVHPIMYSCPQCPYRTSKKVHYIRHVRNVHENKRPYECPTCGLAFKRQDALKQHQVIHFKETKLSNRLFKAPFKCHICKKVVRSAAYLKEHMLTHSDERSFLCEICGASFKTRSVHRNHMKVVHSQELKPICRFCAKTFATKYSLNRHMNQHEISPTEGGVDESSLITLKNTKFRPMKKQSSVSKSADACFNRVVRRSNTISEHQLTSSLLEPKVPFPEVIIPTMSVLLDSPGHETVISTSHSELTTSNSFNLNIEDQIPYIIDSTTEVSNEVISEAD